MPYRKSASTMGQKRTFAASRSASSAQSVAIFARRLLELRSTSGPEGSVCAVQAALMPSNLDGEQGGKIEEGGPDAGA